MASTSKCPYCGSTVRSDEAACPNCGAPNGLFVVDAPRTIFQPKTIEELQEYCAERGMPLLRMRFFIGEDFKEPRAFGIYRDGENVVVYKNKANGTRAIRYQGPNEAYAVRELYEKLLQECHNRGIYPDGKPASRTKPPKRKKKKNIFARLWSGRGGRIFLISAAVILLSLLYSAYVHRQDGYYRAWTDNRIYYRYGTDWYYSDYSDSDGDWFDWFELDSPPAQTEFYDSLGDDWDSDWGVSDFRTSSAWLEDHPDYSSSSYSSSSSGGSSFWDDDDDDGWDWFSWDSDDTDWDSDW